MQPTQITITLDARESRVLREQAFRELRKPKDQARFLLRQALGLNEGESRHPEMGNCTNEVLGDLCTVAA